MNDADFTPAENEWFRRTRDVDKVVAEQKQLREFVVALREDFQDYANRQHEAAVEFYEKRLEPMALRSDAAWVMAWTTLVLTVLCLLGVVWAIVRT